jgi:N-acyl-D-aspartate/D-glutamate deacylase
MKLKAISILLLSLTATVVCGQEVISDIAFVGGRVIDPETGLDKIINVGIKGTQIEQISEKEIKAKKTINISGLVLSPGFIDIHVHGTTLAEHQYQIHDGVTTALEMEMGVESIEEFISKRTGSALVNFGASVGYGRQRILTMEKMRVKAGSNETIDYYNVPLTAAEIEEMKKRIRTEIDRGALGIGVPIGYHPGASRREVFEVYKLAQELSVPIFSHVRSEKALSVQQAIADAVTTGASLHILHINSSSADEIALALEMIQLARNKGFDITTEVYPYTAGSTDISTAIFAPGWQERLNISYSDLQWVATGERLTKETFELNRKKGGTVIVHSMKPEWITMAIQSPLTLIASDGMFYSKLAHPRTAGTFSRVLGKYVREDKALTLQQALTKMTIMPAKRLETMTPGMKKKGRIQVGCDADITVFDPDKIIDKATFDTGLQFSEGIQYVVVNGTIVISEGKTVPNVFPGKPITSKKSKD